MMAESHFDSQKNTILLIAEFTNQFIFIIMNLIETIAEFPEFKEKAIRNKCDVTIPYKGVNEFSICVTAVYDPEFDDVTNYYFSPDAESEKSLILNSNEEISIWKWEKLKHLCEYLEIEERDIIKAATNDNYTRIVADSEHFYFANGDWNDENDCVEQFLESEIFEDKAIAFFGEFESAKSYILNKIKSGNDFDLSVFEQEKCI